jgi:group I intron endonuclease
MSAAGVIYCVTNSANGKRYIGLTRFTAEKRWREHVVNARARSNTLLYKAIRKYGEQGFVVNTCVSVLTLADLPVLEKMLIAELAPEYNQTCGGEVTAGRKYDDATKERIRIANTGQKRSAETKARLSENKKQWIAENPYLRGYLVAQLRHGRTLVDEEKRKAAARAAVLGRPHSDEQRRKLSAACMGRKHSPETIAKLQHAKCRAVVNLDTGVVYRDSRRAAEATGISRTSVIRMCSLEVDRVKGIALRHAEGKRPPKYIRRPRLAPSC